MKKDIIIAGVGGQGIISIAATIGYAAVEAGLYLKQSEVHGMSQRGGDVYSHFRLSDKEIASDLIPLGQADIIISVEPMESLRYLPYLSEGGWIVTNTNPYVNISNYPNIDNIISEISNLPFHVAIDADKIARELGSQKSANMVVLGAASPYLDIEFSILENSIRTLFGRKGNEIIELNLKALKAGRDFSLKQG
jgi:indolepyruvate ferredoxin oxidoreductase, beta subunit